IQQEGFVGEADEGFRRARNRLEIEHRQYAAASVAAARGEDRANGVVGEGRLQFGGAVLVGAGEDSRAIQSAFGNLHPKPHGAKRVYAPLKVRAFDRGGGRHHRDGVSRLKRGRSDAIGGHGSQVKSSRLSVTEWMAVVG